MGSWMLSMLGDVTVFPADAHVMTVENMPIKHSPMPNTSCRVCMVSVCSDAGTHKKAFKVGHSG